MARGSLESLCERTSRLRAVRRAKSLGVIEPLSRPDLPDGVLSVVATLRAISARSAWPAENQDGLLVAAQAQLDNTTAELERRQLALAGMAAEKATSAAEVARKAVRGGADVVGSPGARAGSPAEEQVIQEVVLPQNVEALVGERYDR